MELVGVRWGYIFWGGLGEESGDPSWRDIPLRVEVVKGSLGEICLGVF